MKIYPIYLNTKNGKHVINEYYQNVDHVITESDS